MRNQILETKIDRNKLYFHGSSESKVDRLQAPSLNHPFYVTTDLHYAMAFCTKTQSQTGDYDEVKVYNADPNKNFVYVVTLKPTCKVFDFRDKGSAEFKKLFKLIDVELLNWIFQHGDAQFDFSDIYEFCNAIQIYLMKPMDDSSANYLEYSKQTNDENSLSPRLFLKACSFLKNVGLLGKYKEYDTHQVMAPILRFLQQQGFHGIVTRETDFNDEMSNDSAKSLHVVSTMYAIGIFDKDGLDLLGLVPLSYAWLKTINPEYLQNRTAKTAEEKIKAFISNYKQSSQKNGKDAFPEIRSDDDIVFVSDIPKERALHLLKRACHDVSNFHPKYMNKAIKWSDDQIFGAFNKHDRRNVLVMASVSFNGDESGAAYLHEMTGFIKGGYGKKLVMWLLQKFKKVYGRIALEGSGTKDDPYRPNEKLRDKFYATIPDLKIYRVQNSIWDCPADFFYYGISDESIKEFLEKTYGSKESLNEDIQNSKLNAAINDVLSVYKQKFGFDLSYMKFKVDNQPVYTNGEPCYEYDEDECAGDWTSLGWIRLNPDMKSVMDRYGIAWHGSDDIDEFTKIIIAHELAHEVWNNIADDVFKDGILNDARSLSFNTKYLDTVKPNKLDEETFCEYLAHQVVQQMKDISFPDEEIADLSKQNHIVTHRVSDDANRFNAGDVVMSSWGIPYKVSSKLTVDKVEDSPYVNDLTPQQLAFLDDFDEIAVLELDAQYDPPYTLEQIKARYPEHIYNKLANDPVHKWRAETGIELIHKEPTKEELDRIWKNWQLMPQEMKDISDKKSIELFGCTNAEHYEKLKASEDSLNENKATYLQKYKDEDGVKTTVEMFWHIRSRLSSPQNDIDWWIKKPFSDLKNFVQNFDISNKRQRRDAYYKRQAYDNGAKLLDTKDGYEIWYVPTYDAMVAIGRFYKGRSAKWCVASDDPDFWFDNHENSEFVVLVREHPKNDEFDKVAVEMMNHGRYYNEDDIIPWDLDNEDWTFTNDDLIHEAWLLFKDNGELREQYLG